MYAAMYGKSLFIYRVSKQSALAMKLLSPNDRCRSSSSIDGLDFNLESVNASRLMHRRRCGDLSKNRSTFRDSDCRLFRDAVEPLDAALRVSACLFRRHIREGGRRVTRTRNQRAKQRAAPGGRAGPGRYENAIEYEIADLSKFMTIYAYCVAPLAGAVGVRARECAAARQKLLYINYTVRPPRDPRDTPLFLLLPRSSFLHLALILQARRDARDEDPRIASRCLASLRPRGHRARRRKFKRFRLFRLKVREAPRLVARRGYTRRGARLSRRERHRRDLREERERERIPGGTEITIQWMIHRAPGSLVNHIARRHALHATTHTRDACVVCTCAHAHVYARHTRSESDAREGVSRRGEGKGRRSIEITPAESRPVPVFGTLIKQLARDVSASNERKDRRRDVKIEF